jgi:hypothetical protein
MGKGGKDEVGQKTKETIFKSHKVMQMIGELLVEVAVTIGVGTELALGLLKMSSRHLCLIRPSHTREVVYRGSVLAQPQLFPPSQTLQSLSQKPVC